MNYLVELFGHGYANYLEYYNADEYPRGDNDYYHKDNSLDMFMFMTLNMTMMLMMYMILVFLLQILGNVIFSGVHL